jgi:hypothetical protein
MICPVSFIGSIQKVTLCVCVCVCVCPHFNLSSSQPISTNLLETVEDAPALQSLITCCQDGKRTNTS